MNRGLRWLGIWVGVFAATAGTHAAEIVLEHSAVDKLLTQTLFTNAGRHDLQRGVCHAYLENPSVELKDGRIRIRSHLTSRLASGSKWLALALESALHPGPWCPAARHQTEARSSSKIFALTASRIPLSAWCWNPVSCLRCPVPSSSMC